MKILTIKIKDNILNLFFRKKTKNIIIGSKSEIEGKIIAHGAGKIFIGGYCWLKSPRYNTIELFADYGAEICIGDNVFINQGVRISSQKKIVINDNCLIGDDCIIYDTDWHSIGNAPLKKEQVTINKNVWIGARCILLKGVEIGESAIIGAGSVVTKDVPPNCIAAGNPSRVIRKMI